MIGPGLHDAILLWYAEHGRDLPWRRTHDPYAILVSEMMLQQTQVDRVLPKYHAFLAAYPSLTALAAAPAAEVIQAWQGLGYNLRAVRLHRIALQATGSLGGRLPDTVEGLMALKGIGPYTAAAVACFAFGRTEPVMDTNVRRVLGRIARGPDGPGTATPAELWDLARRYLPPDHAYDWNQALMDLGARVCTESSPRCLICPAQPFCRSAGMITRGVRERRTPYGARPEEPFEGSRRYYRGRIVERLRTLPHGESISLADLGTAIRPDFIDDHLPWLQSLIRSLERDILLISAPDGSVRLP